MKLAKRTVADFGYDFLGHSFCTSELSVIQLSVGSTSITTNTSFFNWISNSSNQWIVFLFFLQLKTNVVLVVRGKNLRGFLLDGFPATPGQAAEFEKFLTGYDYMFWKRFRAAGSKLAPPPKPVWALKPTSKICLQHGYRSCHALLLFEDLELDKERDVHGKYVALSRALLTPHVHQIRHYFMRSPIENHNCCHFKFHTMELRCKSYKKVEVANTLSLQTVPQVIPVVVHIEFGVDDILWAYGSISL